MTPITYAIGDVHGRADLLGALFDAVAADAEAAGVGRRRLILLGDYIDRGPDSRAAVEMVMRGLPGFEMIRLKGNHEELLLRTCRGERRAFDIWWEHGGMQTMLSYGWTFGMPVDVGRHIPAEHLRFLDALPTAFDDGERLFVHAGVDPRRALDDQNDTARMWVRDLFLQHPGAYGRLIVHGHTIAADGPEVRPNRVGIDTGAFRTNTLTCAVFEPDDPRPRFLLAHGLSKSVDKKIGVSILELQKDFFGDAPCPSTSRTPW